MDHNGVTQLNTWSTRHVIASLNEVEEIRVEKKKITKNLTIKNNPISIGYLKNKISKVS